MSRKESEYPGPDLAPRQPYPRIKVDQHNMPQSQSKEGLHMAIRFHCICGKTLKAPEKYAGRVVECPSCDTILTVPLPPEVTPELASAPKPDEAPGPAATPDAAATASESAAPTAPASAPTSSTAPASSTASPPAAAPTTPPPGKRILVAEDDQNLADGIAKLLRNSGFVVELCSRGDEAAEELDRFQPHLIVADLMMPGDSGLVLSRKADKKIFTDGDGGMIKPRIVVISGTDDRRVRSQAQAAGADKFIAKPFRLAELRQEIEGMIGAA